MSLISAFPVLACWSRSMTGLTLTTEYIQSFVRSCVHVCVQFCVNGCTCQLPLQRAEDTCRSWFSPYTTQVPETSLSLSDSATSAFPHWAISLAPASFLSFSKTCQEDFPLLPSQIVQPTTLLSVCNIPFPCFTFLLLFILMYIIVITLGIFFNRMTLHQITWQNIYV